MRELSEDVGFHPDLDPRSLDRMGASQESSGLGPITQPLNGSYLCQRTQQ